MVRCRYNPENIETLEQYVQFQVCVFNIALVSACPTSNIWALVGERREIDMSQWNKLTILHTIPLHIPYKYPIFPCCAQYVWNSQRIFQTHLTQQKKIIY